MYDAGPDRNDYADDRYRYFEGDGNLGNWWTKIRDKVIKPVGRVVAAYYTGGASEVAFKMHDQQKAAEEARKYQKKQLKALEAAGNAYPPQGYPPSMDPAAQRAYAQGMPPSPYQPQQLQQQQYQGYNPAYPGVYAPTGSAYTQVQTAAPSPNMTIQPVAQPQQGLPQWAIPAGIGALALVLLSQRR